MDMLLSGRRVLVTGGTRGIGRATTLMFARAGARVVTCHRASHEPAELLARELKETGGDHRVVRADVTDASAVAGLVRECQEAFGGLDVLVNNAGIDGHAALPELTSEAWNHVLDTDLTAAFLVTQAALPLLGPGSSIVNVGASVAVRGLALRSHYTAAKAGIIGLTRSLCKELGPRGIRVNTVAPGVIRTDPDQDPPEAIVRRIRAMTALGDLGTPQDVAGAILYLSSEMARYVSGVTLEIDGGM